MMKSIEHEPGIRASRNADGCMIPSTTAIPGSLDGIAGFGVCVRGGETAMTQASVIVQ
jgi:hypothetical protein